MNKQTLISLIFTLVVVLLQLVVSPILNISGVTLNFCLSFVVAMSISLNERPKILLSVFLGLVVDLTSGGPVGAFTMLFVLSNVLCASFLANIASTSFQVKALIGFATCAIVNVLNCVIVGLSTSGLTVVRVLTSGQLMSCVFDGIVCICMLLIISNTIKTKTSDVWKSRY